MVFIICTQLCSHHHVGFRAFHHLENKLQLSLPFSADQAGPQQPLIYSLSPRTEQVGSAYLASHMNGICSMWAFVTGFSHLV